MWASAVADVGVVLNVRVDGPVTDPAVLRGVMVDRTAVDAFELKPDVMLSDVVGGPKLDAEVTASGINTTPGSAALPHAAGLDAEATTDPSLFYWCTPQQPQVRQRVFHYINLLPFGLQRVSEVFSVLGRHTNVGLVVGVTDEGLYRVMPYPHSAPLQLERVRSAPRLSYRSDTPLSPEVDPGCLSRIHRESHGHRAHRNMAAFFRRAGVRFGPAVRESSMLSAESGIVSASALVSSSPSSRLLPATPAVAAALPSNIGPSLRAPRRLQRVVPPRLAPAAAASSSPAVTPSHATTSLRGGVFGLLRSPAAAAAATHTPTASSSVVGSTATVARPKRSSYDDASVAGSGALAGAAAKVEDVPEVLYRLQDLQLPPPLALHGPVPPHRVGTRVIARRFGCADVLHMGLILAVDFAVTYTVRFDCDGEVDAGVLHRDVHALGDIEDDGDARRGQRQARDRLGEPCRVRDHVMVEVAQRTHRAVVMAATGSGRYNLALVGAPVPLIEVESRQIQSVRPILYGAVFAQPRHLNLFRRLDTTGSGRVSWKDVRHFVLSSEGFGQPLSFQRLGELQRDMRIRKRTVEPQLLSKVPVQEEEQQLSFRDFEYVLMRVENTL